MESPQVTQCLGDGDGGQKEHTWSILEMVLSLCTFLQSANNWAVNPDNPWSQAVCLIWDSPTLSHSHSRPQSQEVKSINRQPDGERNRPRTGKSTHTATWQPPSPFRSVSLQEKRQWMPYCLGEKAVRQEKGDSVVKTKAQKGLLKTLYLGM